MAFNEFRNRNDKFLNLDQLIQHCPAAFASNANSGVSEKYDFISTRKIISVLASHEILPYSVVQSGARTQEKKETTKHMLRFRHYNSRAQMYSAGGLIPEAVLMTSHDGLSSFKFMSGVFRFICLNGLIVGDVNSSISIRHMGCNEKDVVDAVFEVLDSSSKALDISSQMQSIKLNQDQKFEFANEAFKLRWDDLEEAPEFLPTRLLEPHRLDDRKNDNLFTTFNIAQENLIRGGTRYYSRNPRGDLVRSTTRAVGSIEANLRINKGLWELSKKYLESAS